MLEKLSLDSFTRVLNTQFRLNSGSSPPLEMLLIEATDLTSSPRHEAFSIVFRGPRQFLLQQSIYRLEHESLGSMELFLVPIGVDEDGIRYEVIFNRTRQ